MSRHQSSRRDRRAVWLAVVLPWVLIPGALLGAARADADPVNDVAFLQTLDARGITYASASKIITAGHAICDYLDLGNSLRDTIGMVDQITVLGTESAYFVGVSVAAYCPQYVQAVRS